MGVGAKIRPENMQIFFYSAGVLLQTILVLVSSRLRFQVTSRIILYSHSLPSLTAPTVTSQTPSVVTIIAHIILLGGWANVPGGQCRCRAMS